MISDYEIYTDRVSDWDNVENACDFCEKVYLRKTGVYLETRYGVIFRHKLSKGFWFCNELCCTTFIARWFI